MRHETASGSGPQLSRDQYTHTHTRAHCSRVKFSYLIPAHMTLIDRPLWVMMFSLSQRVAHSGRLQTGCEICFV